LVVVAGVLKRGGDRDIGATAFARVGGLGTGCVVLRLLRLVWSRCGVLVNIVTIGRYTTALSTEHRRLVHVLRVAPTGTVVATTHTNVTTDTDTTSLLGYDARESGGLGKSGELLGGENSECLALDIETVDAEFPRLVGVVGGLLLFGVFVQCEAKTVATLVTNRQVGEDEVSGRRGTVEVGHSRYRDSSENWRGCGCRHTAGWGNGPSMLQ
jgi:hypothetical protein